MGKSCTEIAQTLVDCIQKSNCMKKENSDLKLCLQETSTSGECSEFKTAYANCKRGGLDMRTRIRGPRVY
jgi:cytochrome c oxidase assembly factor 5